MDIDSIDAYIEKIFFGENRIPEFTKIIKGVLGGNQTELNKLYADNEHYDKEPLSVISDVYASYGAIINACDLELINAEKRHIETFLKVLIFQTLNSNLPNEQKVKSIRQFALVLSVFKQIYKVEVIDNLDEFMLFLNQSIKGLLEGTVSNRNNNRTIGNVENNVSHLSIPKLIWEDLNKLGKLSNALYEREITYTKNSFKAFVLGESDQIIINKRKIKTFVWLMDLLFKEPYKCYSLRDNYKGHLMHFEKSVCYHDLSKVGNETFKNFVYRIGKQKDKNVEPVRVANIIIKEILDTKPE